MLTSLALIFLLGLSMAALCQWVHLPRIVGMLAVGIVLGPYALGLLDESILAISAPLRQMALVIILIKAGLSLKLSDLKKVGRPAVMMACVPACFELAAYVLLAPSILGITRTQAAVMGSVLAAVSPAVVVPRMVQLMETGYGTDKHIPQLILAGASCDDLFVMVLFSTFLGMEQGSGASWAAFASIPVSMLLGVALGGAAGYGLLHIFEAAYQRHRHIRNSTKVIVLLGVSFLLMSIEEWLAPIVSVSGLLAVVSMACVLNRKSSRFVVKRLSEKFGKLWLAAEVILFVLIGAAVEIQYTMAVGLAGAGMILLALLLRSAGVLLCLIKTPLNVRERLFCVIAYLPKATVQAAIGSVPLALGLSCGRIVLSVAVLGILITAPLGALGMELSYRQLLSREEASR